MASDEDIVRAVQTIRQQIRLTESRLGKVEGALEAARTASAETEKKLRALGYDLSKDVAAAIQKRLSEIHATLTDARKSLDDAESILSAEAEG